jgi:hypothetical protein
MPGATRKTSPTENRDTDPDVAPHDPSIDTEPVDAPDTATDNTPVDDGPKEQELNPVVIPDGWEAVPEDEGGGMRPSTVPWTGYEGA